MKDLVFFFKHIYFGNEKITVEWLKTEPRICFILREVKAEVTEKLEANAISMSAFWDLVDVAS